MSVVVCKVEKEEIIFASDSIIVFDDLKRTDLVIKLVKENNIIIGGAGAEEDIFLMQIFIKTHRPKNATKESILNFYVEYLAWCKNKEVEKPSSNFIMGIEGKAFIINGYSVIKIKNYVATGAGFMFASAVLELGHTAKEAVSVAIKLSPLCAPPIKIIKMKRK